MIELQRAKMAAHKLLRAYEEGKRDFRGANLSEANLREADLQEADLRGANLRGANLCEANLQEANLQEANLRGSDLRGVKLREAYLRGASLREANLQEASLREVNLQEANLREADLHEASLHETNLCGSDLRGARLGWVSCFTTKVMGAKTDFGIALVGGQSGIAPSSGRTTKYIIHEDGTIGCWTGCFQGTDDDLEAACRENHSGFYLSWYLAQIDIMRQDRDYAINEEGA